MGLTVVGHVHSLREIVERLTDEGRPAEGITL